MVWRNGTRLPDIGDWTENWVGVLTKDLDVAANLGKKIVVPDGIRPFSMYKSGEVQKKYFPCNGYLYSLVNKEGGIHEGNGNWSFGTCDLIIEMEDGVLEKRNVTSYSMVWIYEGELEFPEMYRRYPPESPPYSDRGLHLSDAELAALHWHARAFLDWKEEAVFARFAEYPNIIDDERR